MALSRARRLTSLDDATDEALVSLVLQGATDAFALLMRRHKAAGERGRMLFEGAAQCANCHLGTAFTDANDTLHPASEVGQDPTLASRGTTGMYRTTPLRGVWQHPPYFHDGSAATLGDVVDHYDALLGLGLTPSQRADLVEYLRSL